jgi:hypothetical protein
MEAASSNLEGKPLSHNDELCGLHEGHPPSSFCVPCLQLCCDCNVVSEVDRHSTHDKKPVDFVALCCKDYLRYVATSLSAWAANLPEVTLTTKPQPRESQPVTPAAVADIEHLTGALEAELVAVQPGGEREQEGAAAAQAFFDAIVAVALQRRGEILESVRRETAATAMKISSELVALREAGAAITANSRELLRIASDASDTAVIAHVLPQSKGDSEGDKGTDDSPANRPLVEVRHFVRRTGEGCGWGLVGGVIGGPSAAPQPPPPPPSPSHEEVLA